MTEERKTIGNFSPATFFILPMLDKHPEKYPMFRDCFLIDPKYPQYDQHIHIYTQSGGSNRSFLEAENEKIRQMPGFVAEFDDAEIDGFASWVFKVPKKWAKDFKLIINGEINKVSPEYRQHINEVYPEMAETFDAIFKDAEATLQ